MDLDDTVCFCFHVRKRKIRNFLRAERPRRASQLSQCGSAGTGCGWCVPFLKRFFEQYQREGDLGVDEIQMDAYALGRRQHIRSGKGAPPAGAEPA